MANNQTDFEVALRSNDRDEIFYQLVHHPTMPLSNDELAKLVALNPSRWGRYADRIGSLDGPQR